MFCKHCGYENEPGMKICVHCGKNLRQDRRGKKLAAGVAVVIILAAGIVTGSLRIGKKDGIICGLPIQDPPIVTDAAESQVPETMPKPDPLVLAYSEKAYDAPAYYYYNEEGQVVRKEQEQWNQVTEYAYQANGATKKEIVIRNGSTDYVTEFDDHGNPLAEYSAGKLVYSYANQYDDQDRLVLRIRSVAGERKDIYQYTYDEDGWCEQDYTYVTIHNGEELVHDQVWRRYSPEGVLAHESWTVKDYLPVSIGTIYSCDDHGNVVMKSYQYWSDTERAREDTYYEHTYNSEGLVMKTEVSYCGFYMSLAHMDDPNSGSVTDITLREIITYTYDAENRMTGKRIENVEHGFATENIWEYDEAGNLIRFYGVPEEELSGYIEEIWQYRPLSEVLCSGQ